MVHGINSLFIVVISFIIVWLSYKLTVLATGKIRIPLISSYFVLYFIVFIYIGSVLMNVIPFKHEINKGLYNRVDLVFNIWIYSSLSLILLPFGMFFSNYIFGYKPNHYTNTMLNKDLYIRKYEQSIIVFLLITILFLISIVFFVDYWNEVGKLPIIEVLKGNTSKHELSRLRSNASNNFEGRYYIYNMFILKLPQFLFLVVFFIKKDLKWKILHILLLFFIVFSTLKDLQKSPIIVFFIMYLIAFIYKKKSIKKKVVFRIFILSSITIILMYVFFMGMGKSHSLSEIIIAAFRRIFTGQPSTFYWYQLYVEKKGLLLGHSFPNPADLFPFEYISLSKEVAIFSHPEFHSKDIVGSMPSMFFSDWYANFGTIAAIFSMLLLGIILQTIDIIFVTKLCKKKTLLTSSFYVFLIIFFSKYAGTGYTGLFLENDLYFIFIVIISLTIIRQLLNRIKYYG